MLEEGYPTTDEDRCNPAAVIDSFLEEDTSGNRVADEGKRSRSRRDQAYISMAQGKEEGKEADRHSGEAAEEARIAKYGQCRAEEAAARFDHIEVTDMTKGGSDEDVTSCGRSDIHGQHRREFEAGHGGDQCFTPCCATVPDIGTDTWETGSIRGSGVAFSV